MSIFEEAKKLLAKNTVDLLGSSALHQTPTGLKYKLNVRKTQEAEFLDEEETLGSLVWMLKVNKTDLKADPTQGHKFVFSDRTYTYQKFVNDDGTYLTFIAT